MPLTILKDLKKSVPEIEDILVTDKQALLIESYMTSKIEIDRAAAMAGVCIGTGENILKNLEKENFDWLLIKGTKGYSLIIEINSDLILTVITNEDVRLGLLFYEVRRAVERLRSIYDR